jgi:nicotinamide riboside transporter PnuC
MKPSWGVGVVVAILISIAVGLLGEEGIQWTLSVILLLVGVWTIVSAFAFVEAKDKNYYAGWGIIISGLSLTYIIPLQDAIALILLAMVVLILVTLYSGRRPKAIMAATNRPAPAGETPAATAT